MNLLALFDVDRTLLKGNAVHERAFTHAFKEVFDVDTSINIINHHGMTDLALIRIVMEKNGVPREQILPEVPRVCDLMVEYVRDHIHEDDSVVLPGVPELLSALADRGVVLGLVTGNLQEIAWVKMAHHGLRDHFVTGGFGSDHEDRTELVKLAIERAEALPGTDFKWTGTNAYHFGDADSDLKAAHGAGVRGVGVATGIWSLAEIQALPHYAVLPDLRDTNRVLRLLELA